MRRGRKSLSETDLALWRQVARSVTPLPGRAPIAPEPEPPAAASASADGETAGAAIAAAASAIRPAAAPLQPLVALERRTRLDLRRGRAEIDSAIDLHGLRQDEAHPALIGFLRREQARGSRLVLVVTGKGAAGDAIFGQERGVLRRSVPHWLRLPELRTLVVGFEEAQARHGGTGALYIRLRRRRESGP